MTESADNSAASITFSISPLSAIVRFTSAELFAIFKDEKPRKLEGLLKHLVESFQRDTGSELAFEWLTAITSRPDATVKPKFFIGKSSLLCVYMPDTKDMILRINPEEFLHKSQAHNYADSQATICLDESTLAEVFEMSGLPDYTQIPLPESCLLPIHIAIAKFIIEFESGSDCLDPEQLVAPGMDIDTKSLPTVISAKKYS